MMEFLPFAVQGLVMGVDEYYCHRRRPLRRWERAGHPLDTFSFLVCLVFLLVVPPGRSAFYVYAALSLLSCLFITKDEWEHRELCTGFENWLHALLFMLHPVLLIWAGYLWWTVNSNFAPVIGAAALLAGGFMAYQILYWKAWRNDRQ